MDKRAHNLGGLLIATVRDGAPLSPGDLSGAPGCGQSVSR